ncbi:aldehyde dehydrogenase family protein [Microbacterium azadirachtae]|uniref:Succinate-semialdehyde dehydrogenase [NADP(+)] GabD n=1 Tax=Microbacterium azadirachtae TaxID=582680 RepID=A0A0F0LJN0_9MICO|nr:aldehyde dehydrogenase family protein [Microbacterium azadirachtae]KJL32520.1 Succinate-semialdehyde dehydrogenase [NADP(+)] GabD [Microbacterium azadirachtae]
MRIPSSRHGAAGVFTVLNPATGQPVGEVGLADLAETDAAIDRAHRAYPAWRAIAPGDRARLLRSFASVVEAHIDELAALEVANAGHTIGNARWEAGNVRDVLNYYSASPERHFGKQIPVAGGIDVTFHEPLGVVGIIVPWNFPMPIAGWGFAPALAAGNTVVLKPAELTPLTAMRLGELALEAGLPEGVFTVITGKGSVVGDRFVTNPLVRKVCFTGSTEVGKGIMRGCADQIKRVTLELGGKNANIVFDDADLEAAAAAAPGGGLDNAGQDCCARSRILVQENVYDRFLELLQPAVEAFRVKDPSAEDAEMGPMVSARQRDAVAAHLDGADIAFRGQSAAGADWDGGFWLAPAVVLPRSASDPVWAQELFGPVLAVMPFRDEADAIAKANDTEYGLSGSIFSRDVGRALRVARGVESGNLSINSHSSVRYWTPFGGFKQSGLGRELGPDAPDSFSEVKNVFISTTY